MQFLFHSGEYPQQPWALQCFLVFKYDTERKIARGGFNFSPFEHYHARSFSAYINDYLSPEWISVSVAVFFFFLALEGELMLSVLKLLVMDILKLMGSFAPEVPSAYLWYVRAHPVVLPGAALSSLHLHG